MSDEITTREDFLTRELKKLGVEVRRQNFTGDSSFSTEHTLSIGNIHALGPTFDMAIADFIGKILKQKSLNNVVGILKFGEIQACIQALEKFVEETQAKVDATPDSELDEKWNKLQALAVGARGALGAFSLIIKNASKINEHPDSSFTIRWEGSLKQAMDAMGLTYREEMREEERGANEY